MNTNNKNAPDYVARAETILAILEEELKIATLSNDELTFFLGKINEIRMKLPITDLQTKYRIIDMNVAYITKNYTDAALVIGNYDEE